MSNRNSELLEYLRSLYVPKGRFERYSFVLGWVKSRVCALRAIDESDEYKGNLNCLVISTKGNQGREVFQDYQIKKVDFAKIGKAYAEAYIYDSETGLGYPDRVYYKNPKISIILN